MDGLAEQIAHVAACCQQVEKAVVHNHSGRAAYTVNDGNASGIRIAEHQGFGLGAGLAQLHLRNRAENAV
ncbi:hypothetical protein D3C87_1920780 [compost metagenome]